MRGAVTNAQFIAVILNEMFPLEISALPMFIVFSLNMSSVSMRRTDRRVAKALPHC